MTSVGEQKTLVVIGCSATAIALMERIIDLDMNLKVIAFNESDVYSLDYWNFYKIYDEKIKNFQFERSSKRKLLNRGVYDIIENASIFKVDNIEKTVHYRRNVDKQNAKNILKYDYLVYTDTPFYLATDPKIAHYNVSNLLYLGNMEDFSQYKNPFFTNFKSCTILGTTFLSINLAMQLAKSGKTVHLVVLGKHLLKNIWSDKIEEQTINDLKELKVHVIENPNDYELIFEENSSVIKEISFKLREGGMQTVQSDVFFIAKSVVKTELNNFYSFAEIDYTFSATLGIKRIITDNLQTKDPNIYAIGLGTIERTLIQSEDLSGTMWDDYMKYLEYKKDYEISKFLRIVQSGNLGKPTRIDTAPRSTQIDEFLYDGRSIKYVQVGQSLSYAKMNAKANYGSFEMVIDSETYHEVRIHAGFMVDLTNKVFKGVLLKVEGPDPLIVERVFDDFHQFATQFKLVINCKVTMDELMLSEFTLQTPETNVAKLWEKLYAKLSKISV